MRSSEFRKIINIVSEASGSGRSSSAHSGHSSSAHSGRAINENIKVSKLEANYKDRAIGREQCRNCTHFISPEYCEIVEGIISPLGWCKYHEPKVLEGISGSGSGSGKSGSAHSGMSGRSGSAHSGSGILERAGSAYSGMSGRSGAGSGSAHSGMSGRSGAGSGSAHSGVSGRSGSGITEKWGKPTVVNPEERGKYAGKSKAELLKAYHHLKDTGPHHKGSKEFGRMRELAFAIRAKGGWGKVKE